MILLRSFLLALGIALALAALELLPPRSLDQARVAVDRLPRQAPLALDAPAKLDAP